MPTKIISFMSILADTDIKPAEIYYLASSDIPDNRTFGDSITSIEIFWYDRMLSFGQDDVSSFDSVAESVRRSRDLI